MSVCEMVSRRSSRSSLNGVWPTRHVVGLQRVLVRLWEGSCEGCVPVVEASFNLCPVLPVNDLLEDKTKVHVAGVPLLSVADCRLLGSVVVRSGCDDVERQKTQLVLFLFARERSGSLACRVAPHLRLVWRRGPLAPLVGEGQVNLDFGPV